MTDTRKIINAEEKDIHKQCTVGICRRKIHVVRLYTDKMHYVYLKQIEHCDIYLGHYIYMGR